MYKVILCKADGSRLEIFTREPNKYLIKNEETDILTVEIRRIKLWDYGIIN